MLLPVLVVAVPFPWARCPAWMWGRPWVGRGLDPSARLGRGKLRGSGGALSLWLCCCLQAQRQWRQWVLLWSRLAASPVGSLPNSCRYCR